MSIPFEETIALTDIQPPQLQSFIQAGYTLHVLVFRYRLILRAADRDHLTNLQIVDEFDCNRHTVAGWYNRYLQTDWLPPERASIGTTATIFPLERLDLINLASSTTEQ